MNADSIREQILALTADYYREAHARPEFVPGESRVHYSGRFYDHREIVNLVSSSLDYWLTAGPWAKKFERWMREHLGAQTVRLVNSGSSANLLALAALCAPTLDATLGEDDPPRILPGDEVITPAVTFPTTLAPIVQQGLVPVFVDCEVGTYNIDPALLEAAIGPRTRALFLPHTLGIPCAMDVVMDVARRHRLWVIEDCCDALGATFGGKPVGTFGASASLSFFPAHHISMGEGGAVVTNRLGLGRIVTSLRDWGRDCDCPPGQNDTCGKRFCGQFGDLPFGYDHKYVYSNVGYNLKVTDMQAAIGMAQVEKLDHVVATRRANFVRLERELADLAEHLVLPVIHPQAEISPFGFPVTARRPDVCQRLVEFLEGRNIETRRVFGGNILRQPAFRDVPHRVSGNLERSDVIMRDTMFVGVHPGLTEPMLEWMVQSFHDFFAGE